LSYLHVHTSILPEPVRNIYVDMDTIKEKHKPHTHRHNTHTRIYLRHQDFIHCKTKHTDTNTLNPTVKWCHTHARACTHRQWFAL